MVSPYEPTSSDTGACFHCARSFTASGAKALMPLLCDGCWVDSFAYCSKACKKAREASHRRECGLVRPVLEAAEKEEGMAPFKALLALRAALRAADDPAGWARTCRLQVHWSEHRSKKPEYVASARRMASLIVSLLSNDDVQAIALGAAADGQGALALEADGGEAGGAGEKGGTGEGDEGAREGLDPSVVDEATRLVQAVFLAINVNAISCASVGCGIFPGFSSMFNHSCTENVTHAFDRYDQRPD